MPRKNNRSAETGRFVSRAEAKRSPGTTVQESDESFVSDAMEQAGCDVLRNWLDKNVLLDGDECEVCRAIYRAMRRAR